MRPQNKNHLTKLITSAIVLIVFLYGLNLSSQVFAAPGINQTINFQGKLVNTDGTNVTDGSYTIDFTLYDAASAGTDVWTEEQTVTVDDGIFRVVLGTVTPFGATVFDNDNLFLGIVIDAGTELSPRIRFTASPYAMNAKKVNGLNVTNTTGTLTIPNSTTIAFSGANNVTFTTTGATGVTLPTTGTLATLAGTEELTNKTIGSTGLTFSGATTDITTVSNENLAIVPNGTGRVGIGLSNPSVFKLEVAGNVGPSADSTYDLGSTGVRWANGYFDTLYGDGSNLTGVTASGVSFANITTGTNTTATLTLGSGSALTAATGVTVTGASGSTFDINGDLSIADTSIALDGASTNFLSTGDLSINTNDIFVEKSTGEVGIGTTAPAANIESLSTTEQLRLSYDASNRTTFTVSSGGDLTVAPSGGDSNLTGTLDVSGHAAIGSGASIDQTYVDASTQSTILNIRETFTTNTVGYLNGQQTILTADFAADQEAYMYALTGEIYTAADAINHTGYFSGIFGKVEHTGSGTVNSLTGSEGYGYVSGSGDVTTAIGINAGITQTGTTGSVITNAYGINVISSLNDLGSITTLSGINIESASDTGGGAITTNYGLNIAAQTAGTSDFGARIDAADTQTLWLSGNANNTTASAGIAFGSSRDTNLYRSAANTLTTDDNFLITNQGDLRLAESGSTNYFGLQAAASMDSDDVYTWPSDFPASNGYALTSSTTGVLGWTSVAGGTGDITDVGSMTSGIAFGDSTADDDWLGLGSGAGRITFDDQAIDEITFDNAFVGIGTTAPGSTLDILSYSGTPASFNTGMSLQGGQYGSSGSYNSFALLFASATAEATGGGISEAFAFYNDSFTGDDGSAQSIYGNYSQLTTYAGDAGYSFYASSRGQGTSTGGTQYGLYININDPDVTSYGIYQTTASTINYLQGSLGIGDNSPDSPFEVLSGAGAAQMRLSYADGTDTTFYTNSSGDFTLDSTGNDVIVNDRFAITASSNAASSGSLSLLTGTLGIMDGSDTVRGMFIDLANADHTSTGNLLLGMEIDSITPDANATEIALQIGGGWDGSLRFADSDGTNFITINPPTTGNLTGDYTLTLPVNDGTVSGQALVTDGSGVLSWATVIAGITVRESDASPSVSTVTTVEFGPDTTSTDEFIVSDQTGGVVRVRTGNKVVLTDGNQSLTNKTIGSTGLIFSGATTDITTTSGEALTVTAGGTGDLVFSTDADTNVQVTASAAPGVDIMGISNASQGTVTTGVDGLSIDFTQGDDADATDTNAGLNVNITNSSGDADNLYGINVAAITGGAATEYALVIGTGWDRGLSVGSASNFTAAVTNTSTFTNEGAVTIGTGGNTFTFTPGSGPAYAGTARPAKTISLSPEYAGAAITAIYGAGTDTDIIGVMSSDTDTSGNLLRNYYSWYSAEGILNYYTVAVRVTLPKDFSGWATSNAVQLEYATQSTSAASNLVDVRIYNGSDTPGTVVASSTSNVSSVASTWSTITIDDSSLDDGGAPDWDAADESAVIYIRMGSTGSNLVKIGDIRLNYLSAF